MLIVQVCDFGRDGDALHRMHNPARALATLPGITSVECHFASRHLHDLALQADVLILQFANDWDLLDLVVQRRTIGKRTVFEANDYFFDLQPWNAIAQLWRDADVRELFRQFLTTADGVQTSTQELARHWRARGAREIAVFANQLVDVPPLKPARSGPLTIGWGGSPGHLADLYSIAPLLEAWLERNPDIRLAIMTDETARKFFRLPPERLHVTPFGAFEAYERFLGTIDIGLAPLLPTTYNCCRSDVKFVEYAANGVVGLYGDLEPYRGSVQPGKTGLVYNDTSTFITGLDRLVSDTPLRQRLRENAYRHVSETRRLEQHIGERVEFYRRLAGGTSIRKSRHLAIGLDEPELALRAALAEADKPAAEAKARALLERDPNDVEAMTALGRVLNDRRNSGAGLAILEQAHQLRPQASRIRAEIGRALHLSDKPDAAREALAAIVADNDRYLPAWQFLLRLLALQGATDAAPLALHAREIFPESYPIALLGTSLLPRAQRPDDILHLLDRFASAVTDDGPRAYDLFSAAILAAVKDTPAPANALTLLRRACDIFPRSATLSLALADALLAEGADESAHKEYVRLAALQRQVQEVQRQGREAQFSLMAEITDWTARHSDWSQPIVARERATETPLSIEKARQVPPGIDPQALALMRQGNAFQLAKRYEEAESLYRSALAVDPDFAVALFNLGGALVGLHRYHDAEDVLHRGLRIAPADPFGLANLGAALNGRGRWPLAQGCFEAALGRRPDFPAALIGLGQSLLHQNRLDEAIVHFERAIAADPQSIDARLNLANTLSRHRRFAPAAEIYASIAELAPDALAAWSGLAYVLTSQARFDEMAPVLAKLKSTPAADIDGASQWLMSLNHQPDMPAVDVFGEHRRWGEAEAAKYTPVNLRHFNRGATPTKLRIGYVSPDFRFHPVGRFFLPLISAHNKSAVHVTCYSQIEADDPVTGQIKGFADCWRPIVGTTDDTLVRIIQDDRIDILVDLAGHTADHRLAVFARKPAPVQVSWLGYLNTTGLPTIDFRLTDAVVDPPDVADSLSVETLIRLPDGMLCFAPPHTAPDVVPPPALSGKGVTFGFVNRLAKLNAAIARLWAQILYATPRSRLLVMTGDFVDAPTRDHIAGMLCGAGIPGDRLILRDDPKDYPDYLARFAEIDILLDANPYCGVTTTCEALWMGVPVITLAGDRHAARVAASVLTHAGLADFVAATPQDYVAIATALAADVERLADLRRRMRDLVKRSALCDARKFAECVERAYSQMVDGAARTDGAHDP